MTAAVEAFSSKCESILKDLNQAFLNTKAAVHTSSPPPYQDWKLVNIKRTTPAPDNETREQSIHITPKPVNSPTRKLRSHTIGLLTPANSQTSENKRVATPRVTGNVKKRSKSTGSDPLSARTPVKRSTTVSPYFEKSPSKRTNAAAKVSCIPFPPLSSDSFGLVQERLSHDPFRLLIAVIFLNKTRGAVALPVFYNLMARYPTATSLAAANHPDVVDIIQHLGLQNQRANTCVNLAKAWTKRPPKKQKRYRVLHYPRRNDGKDIKPGEILDENDTRIAWEVGQLPGIGAYAIDSWRIFCRDALRGLPHGLRPYQHNHNINIEDEDDTKTSEMQKEWTRVLPLDKELRAYLQWRWLRNGWVWDPLTGEKKIADEEATERAGKGGVIGAGGDVGVVIAAADVKMDLEMRSKKRDGDGDGVGGGD